jgi:CheY-like chemotaxis protein
MPSGGILTFASRPVRISGDPELEDGDYVRLTISDTGIGMSEEVLDRAFDPFFTTKEVGKGTGLGLSMVYGMARQSGGVARIESAPGSGTSISIFLRAAVEPGAAPRTEEAEPHEAVVAEGPASILVIDDDPDVRHFVAEALGELGYRVREASDGEAALEMVAGERPDLVVLDFIMPGMSGAEVARRILERNPGQPILFVSGYSETDSIRDIAPGAPLLTKPFRAEALSRAVRGALANG